MNGWKHSVTVRNTVRRVLGRTQWRDSKRHDNDHDTAARASISTPDNCGISTRASEPTVLRLSRITPHGRKCPERHIAVPNRLYPWRAAPPGPRSARRATRSIRATMSPPSPACSPSKCRDPVVVICAFWSRPGSGGSDGPARRRCRRCDRRSSAESSPRCR